MTLLFNLLLPAIWLIGGYLSYHFIKKSGNKVLTSIKCIIGLFLVTVVYLNVQPSYLPKGDVPVLQRVPLETTEKVIEDRLLKPKTDEQRQERVDELITVRDEVKAILNDKGENK